MGILTTKLPIQHLKEDPFGTMSKLWELLLLFGVTHTWAADGLAKCKEKYQHALDIKCSVCCHAWGSTCGYRRYYFDQKENKCKMYWHCHQNGCRSVGLENMFESRGDCENTCPQQLFSKCDDSPPVTTWDSCGRRMGAYQTRYFYDPTDNSCKKFRHCVQYDVGTKNLFKRRRNC